MNIKTKQVKYIYIYSLDSFAVLVNLKRVFFVWFGVSFVLKLSLIVYHDSIIKLNNEYVELQYHTDVDIEVLYL